MVAHVAVAVQPPFFKCVEGQHNDLATAFFSTADKLLGTMFSVGQNSANPAVVDHDCGFTQRSLIIFSGIYLVMMALASGVCVPAGLFMPSIMLGASSGLSLGIVLQKHMPGWGIQPGACPCLTQSRCRYLAVQRMCACHVQCM